MKQFTKFENYIEIISFWNFIIWIKSVIQKQIIFWKFETSLKCIASVGILFLRTFTYLTSKFDACFDVARFNLRQLRGLLLQSYDVPINWLMIDCDI